MKKNYLLICLLLIASVSFSQKSSTEKFDKDPTGLDIKRTGLELEEPVERFKKERTKLNNKAYLDVLGSNHLRSCLKETILKIIQDAANDIDMVSYCWLLLLLLHYYYYF